MKVLVVTNFASHYRAPFFALLHERLGAEFLFFSVGGEEYWQPHLGVTEGRFPGTTALGGPSVGKLRLNTSLWREIESREFDVMVKCMNGRLELPMAYAAARRRGASFVLWTGMWMHPRSVFHWLSHPLSRWVYRHADAVVTYGDHVSDFVVREGAIRESVFSAQNAADNKLYGRDVTEDEIDTVKRECCVGGAGMVLAVSRLVPQKGLELLLDAVGSMPSPRPTVVIIGTGELEVALRERAIAASVPLVLVGGRQPGEMPPYYAATDVFVMPSVTTHTVKETWGLSCNEAMLQGTPVVASDAVGAAAGGLVEDGVTGLVVPEGDSVALSTALGKVLGDRTLAQRLGEAGRIRVATIDYNSMVRSFESAIGYALEHRAGRR